MLAYAKGSSNKDFYLLNPSLPSNWCAISLPDALDYRWSLGILMYNTELLDARVPATIKAPKRRGYDSWSYSMEGAPLQGCLLASARSSAHPLLLAHFRLFVQLCFHDPFISITKEQYNSDRFQTMLT